MQNDAKIINMIEEGFLSPALLMEKTSEARVISMIDEECVLSPAPLMGKKGKCQICFNPWQVLWTAAICFGLAAVIYTYGWQNGNWNYLFNNNNNNGK